MCSEQTRKPNTMSVALNNDFYKIALKYDFCNIYVWISTNAINYLLYNIIFNIFFSNTRFTNW